MATKFQTIYVRIKEFFFHIIRADRTTYSIAMSIALGIFVGCAIPLGFHTIFVLLLAFIFRLDKILAFIATWIANPYTIPVIYPFFCFFGAKILGFHFTLVHHKKLVSIFSNLTWKAFEHLGWQILLSFMVGGLFFGLIFGVISYYITYFIVWKYRSKHFEGVRNYERN